MVLVNFSVSSQANATWVILATTKHEEEIEEDTICCTRRRGRYLPKYILERVSVITVISSYLNSKVIQQYQIELLGTEVDLSDTNH